MMPSRPWSPAFEPTTNYDQEHDALVWNTMIDDTLDLIEWDQEVWPIYR